VNVYFLDVLSETYSKKPQSLSEISISGFEKESTLFMLVDLVLMNDYFCFGLPAMTCIISLMQTKYSFVVEIVL